MAFALLLAAGVPAAAQAEDTLLSLDPRFDALVTPGTPITELARGFTWSEGPAWDDRRQMLYFSDVPENRAYRWSPDHGVSIFLSPSGLQQGPADGFREPGSNGLMIVGTDTLLIANHGARAVEALSLETNVRTPLATHYQGKRLNSPNDVAVATDGTLFFTDPPYGLAGMQESPLKEQPHSGVYMVRPGQDPMLVDGSLSFPNGIALSPDEQTLYVAVSDPEAPIIYAYEKTAAGYANRRIFLDTSDFLAQGWPGLPDGMTVADSGHLFATGPGGIFVLAPSGELLGMIRLARPTANCTLTADGRLFITSQDRLLQVSTLATRSQAK